MSAQRIQGILHKDGWVRTQGLGTFSSIVSGGVCSAYEKEGRRVFVGLNEIGYPPSLITPRPNVTELITDETGQTLRVFNPIGSDGLILEFIQSLSDEQILNNLNSNEPWKGMDIEYTAIPYG